MAKSKYGCLGQVKKSGKPLANLFSVCNFSKFPIDKKNKMYYIKLSFGVFAKW